MLRTHRKQLNSPAVPTLAQIAAERARVRSRRLQRTRAGIVAALLIIAAAIASLTATMLFPVMRVYGDSMQPTLQNGETVVLEKNAHLEPGDIVAFYYNNTILVKRVIGLSGDRIAIGNDGVVTVNEQPLSEPYVRQLSLGKGDITYPYRVPEGSYFVLGDNRPISLDSRESQIGSIRSEMIVGRVRWRIWPLKKAAGL